VLRETSESGEDGSGSPTVGSAGPVGESSLLVDGMAPEGVDLKSVPALTAPRLEISFNVAPEVCSDDVSVDATGPLAMVDEGGWAALLLYAPLLSAAAQSLTATHPPAA